MEQKWMAGEMTLGEMHVYVAQLFNECVQLQQQQKTQQQPAKKTIQYSANGVEFKSVHLKTMQMAILFAHRAILELTLILQDDSILIQSKKKSLEQGKEVVRVLQYLIREHWRVWKPRHFDEGVDPKTLCSRCYWSINHAQTMHELLSCLVLCLMIDVRIHEYVDSERYRLDPHAPTTVTRDEAERLQVSYWGFHLWMHFGRYLDLCRDEPSALYAKEAPYIRSADAVEFRTLFREVPYATFRVLGDTYTAKKDLVRARDSYVAACRTVEGNPQAVESLRSDIRCAFWGSDVLNISQTQFKLHQDVEVAASGGVLPPLVIQWSVPDVDPLANLLKQAPQAPSNALVPTPQQQQPRPAIQEAKRPTVQQQPGSVASPLPAKTSSSLGGTVVVTRTSETTKTTLPA